MDACLLAPAKDRVSGCRAIRQAQASVEDLGTAFACLAEQIGPEALGLLVLFVSPSADRETVASLSAATFPDTPVIGCTTAGEIASRGYTDDHIVAVGFSAAHFAVSTLFLDRLDRFDRHAVASVAADLRGRLVRSAPDWGNEFALLLVDGLSLLEDRLVATLSPALGGMPLFGGSAGDRLDFAKTFVLHGGAFHQNAAVLALVRSRCRVEVFGFDHLEPTDAKMVVTEADPGQRVVREINAEPAAREYARIVGIDPCQLSPFVFAAHPVVVKLGGRHHVRAIQQVLPNGDLRFFSAIDEGLVLTVARPRDMVEHLDSALASLCASERPEAIIAFDCVLRRIEAEHTQRVHALSKLLAGYRVTGFSTYGEQMNSVHVNQTMTGVAIYAPPARPAR